MPAVLLKTRIALVPIRDNVIGAFFDDVSAYRNHIATSADAHILPNGVKLLGIEIHAKSDDNLVNLARVYYDDSKASEEWAPTLGMVDDRNISTVAILPTVDLKPYKIAVMVLDSSEPIVGNIADLVLA